MGQSSSRNRRARNEDATPVAEHSTASPAVSAVASPTSSRRATVRRSILNLVKPSSEAQGGSTRAPRMDGTSQRTWRNSRRWSKSPAPAPAEPIAESVIMEPEQSLQQSRPEEPHQVLEVAHSEPSTSSVDLPAPVPIVEEPPPLVVAPETALPPVAPSRAQFPPPGTLVVVQGVVHTTDGSPPEETPTVSEDPAPTLNTVPTTSESPAAESRSTPAVDAEPSTTPDIEDAGGIISSSSVDVLATLLCVAAATTAASLLSGTSIPIFPRPTPSTDTSDASRGRNVWGNLRERLGLARSNTPLPPVATANGSNAREVMLAEMARAFNMGFGLNSPANTADPETVAETDGTTHPTLAAPVPERPAPAADSFERFLLDLPGDLRTALYTRQPTPVPSPSAAWPPAPVRSRDPTDIAASYPLPPSPLLLPEIFADGDDDEDFNGLANLQDVSSSEDEDDYEDEDEEDAEEEDHTPFPSTSTPSTSSRTIHTTGGGIHWWRLYRFPPMPATALTTPSPDAPASTPAEERHPDATTATPSEALGAPLPPTPTPGPGPSTLVPVILVGLQSVNRPQDSPTPTPAPGTTTPNTDSLRDDSLFEDPSPPTPTQIPERGRRWGSRAADAIRNLRPGRRGASAGGEDDAGALPGVSTVGARTFLIYVIGGHYPPDHRIVTGANTMDSFEALWELAEMIGQAKLPTATMDDIDNSGLEIIKSPDLARYEEEGKVSNNCVDRCLICLDDYAPDEEIRLMTCRHAFHKECIDKWLSTGRNNCPACRSKGVSTGEATTPTTTEAQTQTL